MIYLVDLEAVETRYTAQWKEHVPALLQAEGHEVTVIAGPADIPAATTPGAFLNFGGTNVYKASQVEQIGRLFCNGSIKAGDQFLFTDAWHPGIINLKYMSSLLGIPVKIHALWHAGSYDPADFLGRLIGDEPWVRHSERAFFHAIDHNYFATEFHIDMFCEVFGPENAETLWKEALVKSKKIVRTGWPMGYMKSLLAPYKGYPKKNLILFPHRIAPEKQVEIFRDLATQLPQYEFVVCQDKNLTKEEYHTLLAEAKMVFSCSLQETLGIGCYEGAVLDAIPLVPDRLSYSEMYFDLFKYPSAWTQNNDAYLQHRHKLKDLIIYLIENYNMHLPKLEKQAQVLHDNYFTSDKLHISLAG